MVAADSENSIVSLCRAADTITAAADVVRGIAAGDWLAVQGNLTLKETLAACRGARAAGGHVLFNPAPLRWPIAAVLAQADVVVVNRVEAALLSGQDDPALAARKLQAQGAGRVVVTLGEAGCLWVDGTVQNRPAMAVDAVNSSGAGDSFCGVLVAELAGGATLGTAIVHGQAAAAVTVTRHGAFAALPTKDDLGDARGRSGRATSMPDAARGLAPIAQTGCPSP